MFGLSMGHLIILLIVVVIVFGAKRLPELGEGVGKGIRGFKKGLSGEDETKEAKKVDDDSSTNA